MLNESWRLFMMKLGNSLFQARKRAGLSQEDVAEKLGVSRQTVSKWELSETLPDIRQSKRMANLYGLSLDALIDFDLDVQEIQDAIDKSKPEVEAKVDWTAAWGKKYPILLKYQDEVKIDKYALGLDTMIQELIKTYQYSPEDAFLVLKDILAQVWKDRN